MAAMQSSEAAESGTS